MAWPLASVYRRVPSNSTWESACSGPFARLARILEPTLEDVDTSEAAAACPGLVDEFISGNKVWPFSLKDFGISKEEIPALARQVDGTPRLQEQFPEEPTYNEMLQNYSSASF